MIKVGCCGFPMGRARYYDKFGVVEVQQTFYQLPKTETAMKWRDEARDQFEFCIKAWQLITHEATSPTYRKLKMEIPEQKRKNYGSFKPTDEVLQAWNETAEIAEILKAKIIVFQCPASFKPEERNVANLRKFFEKIRRGNFTFAWEPRGKWSDDLVKNLCQELDLIHCVDPLKSKSVFGKMKYYRLHGMTGYRYKYSDSELRRLVDICISAQSCYCMFNNTEMLSDAQRFLRMVNKEN